MSEHTAEKNALVWECGPHTNAWNGHDARCRKVPASPHPKCTCSAGDAAEFAAQHATLCPRFAHPRVLPPVEGRA